MDTIVKDVTVATVAAGSTYLIARRKTSGRVDTTEASVLRQEGQAMRRQRNASVT